jgi:hypothetical protein
MAAAAHRLKSFPGAPSGCVIIIGLIQWVNACLAAEAPLRFGAGLALLRGGTRSRSLL